MSNLEETELIPFLMNTVKSLIEANHRLTQANLVLAQQKSVPVVFQQHLEADEDKIYTTDTTEDEGLLTVTEYGDIQFWNGEVSNEISELFGEVESGDSNDGINQAEVR